LNRRKMKYPWRISTWTGDSCPRTSSLFKD
jgi:hypothetical protein